MFERFTQAARDVVVRAQHEARELGQQPIGTEHTLIALLADAEGPIAAALRADEVDAAYVRAEVQRRVGPSPELRRVEDDEDAAALRSIGIDLDAVRRAIEENFGPGSLRLPRGEAKKRKGRLFGRFYASGGHLPFSPRNKKVLELSLREAIRLKHNFIAPEHLLLGMLREGQGLAVQILAEKGVDLAALREAATRSLHHPAA